MEFLRRLNWIVIDSNRIQRDVSGLNSLFSLYRITPRNAFYAIQDQDEELINKVVDPFIELGDQLNQALNKTLR